LPKAIYPERMQRLDLESLGRAEDEIKGTIAEAEFEHCPELKRDTGPQVESVFQVSNNSNEIHHLRVKLQNVKGKEKMSKKHYLPRKFHFQ
jgi:hypothetical protein